MTHERQTKKKGHRPALPGTAEELRWHSLRMVFVRGAGSAFSVRVAGLAAGLAAQVLAARWMGSVPYGRYVYVLSWLNMVLILSLLGFDRASLRFVAAYRAREQWPLLHGFVRESRKVVLRASLGLAAAAALVIAVLSHQIGTRLAVVFWLACLLLPFAARLELSATMLRSLKRVLLSLAPLQVLRPLLFAAVLLAVRAVAQTPPQAASAMLAWGFATLVALVVVETGLHAALPEPARAPPDPQRRTREWRHVAAALLVLAACQVAFAQTDILVLGIFAGTRPAGIYSAATRIASLASFALVPATAIAAPMISELFAGRQIVELQRLLTLAVRAVATVAVAAGVVIFLAARPLLALWGPDFVSGHLPLLILTAGQVVNALAGLVGSVMVMTGHQGAAARTLAAIALLNVILDLILVPLLGALGAALATAGTTVLWNLTLLWYVLRHLGVNPAILPLPRATVKS